MSLSISLKIDNADIISQATPVKIINPYPILSWAYESIDISEVNTSTGAVSISSNSYQVGFQILISTNSVNLGTESFAGNRVDTGYINSQSLYWRYNGISISRGNSYYGQIRIFGNDGRVSSWKTFYFVYNSTPFVENVVVSPDSPTVTDNLVLSYDFEDADGDSEDGTEIKWFKNGVYQKQFDNLVSIEYVHLDNKDVWSADVYPSDGYEFGGVVSSGSVLVGNDSVSISEIKISPKNPTVNDILSADYEINDINENSNVLIRWYVNGSWVKEFDNDKYIKPNVSAGDEVFFDIKHVDSGSYLSSETSEILISGYFVEDIIIDGNSEPLNISILSPHVQWTVAGANLSEVNYVSVKIGSFYGADNILSDVFEYRGNFFTIPSDVLERGRDYYLSISVSSTTDFYNYSYAHFRTYGSRWEEKSDNSVGWTIESLFYVERGQTGAGYNSIRINDGSKFAEIRIYNNKISLISKSKVDYSVDNYISRVITIAGKNSDIKVYIDRNLVIDGTGLLNQVSTSRRLEISSLDENFGVNYKYLLYTVSGYFLPGSSSEYSNIKFYKFMSFSDSKIASLKNYHDSNYIFGVNPNNMNKESKVYVTTNEKQVRSKTVSRTISPINKINKSIDGNNIIFSHYNGVTIFSGHYIGSFDMESTFNETDSALPNGGGWYLVKDSNFESSYLDSNGLNINSIG